ncbi:hypothetical protein JCM19235_4950 [Vibrio maritimus]|uniref:Uncharacterized protein n=1 Tax=Vibrio maritimus TaxID=990268 RepID=A0A090S3W7_9VIBR|nr:hypothetical protein JCM19235_4950 [Vibrio maritimus]
MWEAQKKFCEIVSTSAAKTSETTDTNLFQVGIVYWTGKKSPLK